MHVYIFFHVAPDIFHSKIMQTGYSLRGNYCHTTNLLIRFPYKVWGLKIKHVNQSLFFFILYMTICPIH